MLYVTVIPMLLTKALEIGCRNFTQNSQYEIELKNPKISLTKLVKLDFKTENIKIKSKVNNDSFNADKVSLSLRILPLFGGNIHLNSIEVKSLDALLNLSKQVVVDRDILNKIKNSKIKCDVLKIDSYATKFYQQNVASPIVYSGKDFLFEKKNRYLKLKVNSVFNILDNPSVLRLNLYLPRNNDLNNTIFNVEASNPDISRLKNYFKNYLPEDLQEIKGAIKIVANMGVLEARLQNFAVIMKDPSKSIILPANLNFKSQFSIKRNSILIDEATVLSKNLDLSIKGSISDYFGKSMPSVDLKFIINKSSIDDIVKIIPAFKVEEFDAYKLKKYGAQGDILANFSLKGRFPEPELHGAIFLSDVTIVKSAMTKKHHTTINIKLLGKQVEFEAFIPTGGAEHVKVQGTQDLYNLKHADLKIKSTEHVDLSFAQSVLNPLHEILNFIIGPVPIMEIGGLGNADFIVKGNRKNPHLFGVMNFKNVTASFNDASAFKMKKSDAELKFNDQNILFETKSGYLNDKAISINGTSNVFGKFNFNINSKSQMTKDLYNQILSSPMLKDFKDMFPKIENISGTTDFNINAFGEVNSLKDLKINKNVLFKGDIKLNKNSFVLEKVDVNRADLDLTLDGMNVLVRGSAFIGDSLMTLNAKINDKLADLDLSIPKLNLNVLVPDGNIRSKKYLPLIDLQAKYKGKISEIEYDKLSFSSKIISSLPNSAIFYEPNAEISLINNKLSLKGLKGYIKEPKNNFSIDLKANDISAEKVFFSGSVLVKLTDITVLNEILSSSILPKDIRKYAKDYEFKRGAFGLVCKFINGKPHASSDLSGIVFEYVPYSMPVQIINGSARIKNNILILNKINLLADEMPVLLDGEIKNIFTTQNFNLYVNSKPKQEFIDKYINKNQVYPIKIKGDIVYWVKLKGIVDDYELKSKFDLSKDSSLYYYGATIGDIENAISMFFESRVLGKNKFKIKDFSYDKLIDSQSGRKTALNMVKVRGDVDILPEDLKFKDLVIKTNHPTDARIFNIIFRKPNIKQGQFTSDLVLNGNLSAPKIIGDFHIFETDIPFFDTIMKNIEFVFKDKFIDISSKGEIMGNELVFAGTMKNKLTKPYSLERGSVYTKDLNLNQIVNAMKISEVDDVSTFESFEGLDLDSIEFKNLKFKADNVELRNIHATDFEAVSALNKEGLFNVNDFKFNIAQGRLSGKYSYNIKNSDLGLNLNAENIDANDITYAVFDLNNQIYGDMTGVINLTCEGSDFNRCLETMSGESKFKVKDGKMPKLGSLEYLLKAGNLIKGGITGLSINNVVELITPQKTGEFSEIKGDIRIKDGVARNIVITTKGKDLSLFIHGTYNFATSIADMEVLGHLSRHLSTMFGPIGNISINTLFNLIPGIDLEKDSALLDNINKIPGLELSSKAFRKFIAVIKGNINGDDYVTSFKWIN